MQRFPCPWCGPRDDIEFRYGGDAGRARPARDASGDTWARYLHGRINAQGPARELWVHWGGCGRWLVLERDTKSHAVIRSTSP